MPYLTTSQVDDKIVELYSNPADEEHYWKLCNFFLTLTTSYDICQYDGVKSVEFVRLFDVVSSILDNLALFGLSIVTRKLIQGELPNICAISNLFSSPQDAASKVFFLELIRLWGDRGNKITASDIDAILESWITTATLGLHHVKYLLSVFRSNVDQRDMNMNFLRSRVKLLGPLFQGDRVKREFVGHLMAINDQNQVIFPSGFICAPSGSGKTTFAHHMCCQNTPAAYVLFDFLWKSNTSQGQKVYHPFHGLSDIFINNSRQDVSMLNTIDLNLVSGGSSFKRQQLYQSGELYRLKSNDDVKFKLVGFIVSLFEELVRRRAQSPNLSWSEIQCSVNELTYASLTIEQGRTRLQPIKDKYPELPLLLFMDECTLGAYINEPGLTKKERKKLLRQRLQLVRNIARCLKIVIIFMGTDAKAINFVSSRNTNSSDDVDEERPECSFVFNELPSFDSKLLEDRCKSLRELFEGSRSLKACVDFLESVSPEENPWFIEICLRELEKIPQNEIANTIGINFLAILFDKCRESFTCRKRTCGRQFSSAYLRGQLRYLTNFTWKGSLKVDEFDPKALVNCQVGREQIINRHVGHLFAYPNDPKGPFFTLATREKYRVYQKGISMVKYNPCSVFNTFDQAQLTGLSLFGISLDHKCFPAQGGEDLSVFDAFKLTFTNSAPKPGYNLQLLFDCSAIIASRAGGVLGCSIEQFLTALFNEFRTNTCAVGSVMCSEPFPMTGKIPLLAPMPLCGWSDSLLSLFSVAKEADERPVCVGIYKSQLANEHMDGSAHYYQPNLLIRREYTKVQATKILRKMREPFPCSLNGFKTELTSLPRLGKITAVKRSLGPMAFAVECKQLSKPLSVAAIVKIIDTKCNSSEYSGCNLLFILAYRIVDLKRLKPPQAAKLAYNDCAFWYLLPDENHFDYVLTRHSLPESSSTQPARRQVVLLSLEDIWGSNFGEYSKFLRNNTIRF